MRKSKVLIVNEEAVWLHLVFNQQYTIIRIITGYEEGS